MSDNLMFGLAPPAGVETAWGCRAITRGATVDVVHDRVDAIGPDDRRGELLTYMRETVGDKPFRMAEAKLGTYQIKPNEAKRVKIYEDDKVLVEADTKRSHGYLYVVAYFKADAPAA